MGISMHIFTARDLIHLRQSRPSGHGITAREGAGGRSQHLVGKKNSVSRWVPAAGAPQTRRGARVTSREGGPAWGWGGHGLL